MNNPVGKMIKKLRQEKSMTQDSLASKCHTTKSSISKWEKGTQVPSLDVLKTLADIFDVNVSIFTDEEKVEDEKTRLRKKLAALEAKEALEPKPVPVSVPYDKTYDRVLARVEVEAKEWRPKQDPSSIPWNQRKEFKIVVLSLLLSFITIISILFMVFLSDEFAGGTETMIMMVFLIGFPAGLLTLLAFGKSWKLYQLDVDRQFKRNAVAVFRKRGVKIIDKANRDNFKEYELSDLKHGAFSEFIVADGVSYRYHPMNMKQNQAISHLTQGIKSSDNKGGE